IILSSSSLSPRQGAAKIAVVGVVTSSESNQVDPIPGVAIRADRNGRVVAQTKTSSDGSYRLEVDKGEAFDVIYDHTAWHADTLKRLSGLKEHTVNKVLYRPGTELDYSPEVAFDILSAYEHIHFLAILNGT